MSRDIAIELIVVWRELKRSQEVKHLTYGLRTPGGPLSNLNLLALEVAREENVDPGEASGSGDWGLSSLPSLLTRFPQLLEKPGVRFLFIGGRLKLFKLIVHHILHDRRPGHVLVHVAVAEPVSFHEGTEGAASEILIMPRTVIEDEGEASKEYLGVGRGVDVINTDTLVPRLVIPLLQLPYEGLLAGVKGGFEIFEVGVGYLSFDGSVELTNLAMIVSALLQWGIGIILPLYFGLAQQPLKLRIHSTSVCPFTSTIEDTIKVLANFLGHCFSLI
ncbi:5'-3' exoribonuclease 2 [Babesia caballi]|uniref:5'-3' exoribonuclease 2 n=1 Tax=Babesia caballi TaxID=5871 RepID=A0AAV4LRA4_BABCB|nr:5'-3' exoribonuclease 2 [Babesia caballi]